MTSLLGFASGRSAGGGLILALALGGAVALVATPGETPYPRSEVGRFEVNGLDFRPSGAWRRGTDAIRARRRSLLEAGRLGLLNQASSPRRATRVSGTFYVPVVPIAFQNVAPPFLRRTTSRCSSRPLPPRFPTAFARTTPRCLAATSRSMARCSTG